MYPYHVTQKLNPQLGSACTLWKSLTKNSLPNTLTYLLRTSSKTIHINSNTTSHSAVVTSQPFNQICLLMLTLRFKFFKIVL